MPDYNNLEIEIKEETDKKLKEIKDRQLIDFIPDDNNSQNKIFEIMKDLQPVSFLISMCLIIAAFFINNHDKVDGINLTFILMASLFFCLAYMGLFAFKYDNFPLFFHLGILYLLVGACLLFFSFTGIVEMISKATTGNGLIYSDPISLFGTASFLLIPLILTMYYSGKVKKGKWYDRCKIFFHLSIIFYSSCIVLSSFVITFGIQSYILKEIISAVFKLFWIFIYASLFPLAFINSVYKHNSAWETDLRKKLKDADVYSMNPIYSLKVIVAPVINFCLLMISFFLLAIGFWLLLSGFGLSVNIL